MKTVNPHVLDEDAGRRDILKALLGSGVVAFALSVLYPLIRFMIPPKEPEVIPAKVLAGRVC